MGARTRAGDTEKHEYALNFFEVFDFGASQKRQTKSSIFWVICIIELVEALVKLRFFVR
jgi:hypothetical protein